MRWRDSFDLPERFANILPRQVTEILVAAVMVTLAVGGRVLIGLAFQNVVAFALVFPAVVGATLLAGPRSGALVIVCGQLLAWYFLVPYSRSLVFASPSDAVSLALATFAQLLMLWCISGYRRALRDAASREANENAKLEQALDVLNQRAHLDAEVRAREDTLRETRQNLMAIYEASADGLTLCRAMKDANGELFDYQVIEVNKAHGVLTGATREMMLGAPVSVIAPPVDPRWFQSAAAALKSGAMQHFDVQSPATHRWLNIRVSPVSDVLFQQTFVDVTDRHRLEEQRSELLKEMSHRVMNNFQMIASFLYIQAAGAEPAVRNHLKTAENRVRTLAKLHSFLAYTESENKIDAKAYFAELCEQLQAVIDRPDEVALECRCDPLFLSTDKIVPLGFVISELVTNAAKYAFPSQTPGRIVVELADEGACCRLTIRDNGSGLPQDQVGPQGGGLGTRLVKGFVKQIAGRLVTTSDGGVRHEITFKP